MDGIKIEVTGNIARVIERPARITAGTVGLPVEFSFDNQWEGLSKTAVFKAGCTEMIVENLDVETIVPWEATANPDVWLSIGVYGVNADGSVAIPTIWANVCVICEGTNPEGDVSTAPTLPVWQRLWNAIGNLLGLTTNAKGNLVEAINEVNNIALAGGIESDPTLTQSGKAADAKATGDKIKSLTASDVGARPDTWMPTAEEVGARPDTWLPTIADIGAAPAGYGFSEDLLQRSNGLLAAWGETKESLCSKIDTMLQSMPNHTAKLVLARGVSSNIDSRNPYEKSGNCLSVLYKLSDNDASLVALSHGATTPGSLWRLHKTGGVWQGWEWENPPLEYGKEYRTTERYNGKPVYTKLLNLGALPNASTSQYSFGFNETVNHIEVNVRTSGGSQIPHYLNGSGVGTASYYNNMNTIWVTTTENRSGSNLIVKLKYVKEG